MQRNSLWKDADFEIEDELCFVLMPINEPWSDGVWELLKSAASECDMRCERADEKDGRVVMDDIWEGICRSHVIIADLTGRNPNVTYELGIAHALGKEVILLSQNSEDVPFDLLGLRLIIYGDSLNGARKLSNEVAAKLRKIKALVA
jgi:hypothetical protein